MYEDKTLTCRECGNEFVFSANEQEFFAQKGFQNEPSRCPACRAARRAQNGNGKLPGPCTPSSATAAAARPRCLSSPAEIVPCTAVSASKRSARPGIDWINGISRQAAVRQPAFLSGSQAAACVFLIFKNESREKCKPGKSYRHRTLTFSSSRSRRFSASSALVPRAKR